MSPDLSFIHIYEPEDNPGPGDTLVLFHGTGGDERSMLDIGRQVSHGAGLLSPRGKVLENGMPRFFRRLSEGVFDQKDLKERTVEMAGFLKRAAQAYGLNEKGLNALGYSNGANIAASLILTYPGLFRKAVLLHPMIPFVPKTQPDLSGTSILITAGENDPMVDPGETRALENLFSDSGANVETLWHTSGHSLTTEEIERASSFLSES